MPKHITRLVLLLVAFGGAAYAAKVYFTADSFYAYGHYRGNSVAEIASDKPRYKGSQYCESCHAEEYTEWSQGVHHSVKVGKVVQCEVCHGAAGGRDTGGLFEHVATGVDHPASGKLAIPTDTRKLCPLCHEKIVGRPSEQPQIVIAEHAGTKQCTACHNPHSPMLLTAAATAAPSGPDSVGKAAVCAGCHGANGVSTNPAWPNLAGQKKDYLVAALKAYRDGSRRSDVMAGMAKGLSESDIEAVATFYSNASGH
jgi:cytochrome c553